ncbi:50S ribosomal protein L21 [Aphanothece sacrum]|uniref:Large ribosomal subunit protein bL21 n=1 Tax=Aphanothece sacrum FPU1 TaxID=1920663 RepID=A0A401IKL1_APHSA|nr:50S ribosomal protein L21 [Aphanothece sacrum]GBF81671.1 50S ribosomal protein L21 [Aphanothece sacrum FPU1]GBF84070.1 50S ribosomal protein L21 [Aphanothece sacrum FPU3]
MTYAIIETGGKQLRVEPGRFYDVDRLGVETDSPYSIDKVLLINHDDGITVGQPFIEGAIVEGLILEHRRGRKIIVYKMRPKKKTRKKRGHRQELTRLMITAIKVDGSVIAETELDGVSMAATQASEEETTASTEEE